MAPDVQFATPTRDATRQASAPERRVPHLTTRQLEVLQLIVDGRSDAEIATALGRSKNTVGVHRANIMRVLGLRKTIQIVVYAIREGLVDIGCSQGSEGSYGPNDLASKQSPDEPDDIKPYRSGTGHHRVEGDA